MSRNGASRRAGDSALVVAPGSDRATAKQTVMDFVEALGFDNEAGLRHAAAAGSASVRKAKFALRACSSSNASV